MLTSLDELVGSIRPGMLVAIPPDYSGVSIAATRAIVRPGSIILLHAMYPNRRPSLQAVRGIIETLTQDGYRFVTVTELLRAERGQAKS